MIKKNKKSRLQVASGILTELINRPGFPKAYGIFSVVVLLMTTILWVLLSALVHQHNADQLIDPYLFEHASTFHNAIFPGQHSFLIKWPLFLLVSLCGSSTAAFLIATIAISLLTVGILVVILYKIERRPVVFGTLCLALASVLLLIPAEPYPGALLPLNMAMLSTRNLEYIVYITALILLIRAPRSISWSAGLATLLLGLLIASDKLFLTTSIGGSLAALVAYFIFKQRQLMRLALRWLLISILASVVAFIIIWLIAASGVTTISTSSGAGPYALIHSFKDLTLGTVYGVLGIFTNLGANPALDTTMIKSIPSYALHHLISKEGIAYLINITIATAGLVMSYRLWWTSLRFKPKKTKRPPHPINTSLSLSLALIWTTLAALGVFVISNHYYVVDARYLTITLFTVFIVMATYLQRIKLARRPLVIISIIIICSIGFGMHSAWQSSTRSVAVLSNNEQRNSLIVAALAQHPVQTLIGDYWRVLPIKHRTSQPQNVLPLANCTTPRDVLISNAWKQDLSTHSFAYLLPFKQSTTGYPACTIEQVTALYGRPNASQVIAGTVNTPEEMLLFYDHGINKVPASARPTSSILPRPISQIHTAPCNNSTIMNIVAHQDDDILFMNPDLIHNLKAGDCVRSVYLTTGDGGNGQLYWLGREEGSKAAYAEMLGIKDPIWITRTVTLSDAEFVTIAGLKNNPKISLIFLHLPDGNTAGQGFSATKLESLQKLEAGTIPSIHSVDGQSTYSSDQLIAALARLIETYQPTEIHTQATHNLSQRYADHSDHLSTGRYAEKAYQQYIQQYAALELKFYIGYPIRERPENVSPQDVNDTENAFFTYAQHDGATCSSVTTCSEMSYIYYLKRQYLMDPTEKSAN
jgi:LmbE family N-acetylglucosaminyl deacetylase